MNKTRYKSRNTIYNIQHSPQITIQSRVLPRITTTIIINKQSGNNIVTITLKMMMDDYRQWNIYLIFFSYLLNIRNWTIKKSNPFHNHIAVCFCYGLQCHVKIRYWPYSHHWRYIESEDLENFNHVIIIKKYVHFLDHTLILLQYMIHT